MLKFTPVAEIAPKVHQLRQAFNEGRTRAHPWRVEQLQRLSKMLRDNKKEIVEALVKDLHMDPLVSDSEVEGGILEIEDTLGSLKEWMQPVSKSIHVIALPGSGLVYNDPLGCVLLISPWNYPVSLVIKPLIGALAAGNCVCIKPSEISQNTSAILGDLLTKTFDPKYVYVVQGAVEETEALLKLKWDKILYTGNGSVGKIVMKAAAEHLTPVILELGGKSPVYVDKSVDVTKAAPRLVWGKFTNAGQTCIAPDYVLCHETKYNALVAQVKAEIEKFYGKDPSTSNDFGRIINSRHAQRIADLMKGGKIEYGGEVDVSNRFISPTVITDVDIASKLMQDEIFGPLLPILPIKSADAAIEFINSKPKPLALYVFSQDKNVTDQLLNSTSSGGACVNECLLHNICRELPFGGVGESGTGAYNGKTTFDVFSHQKSVLNRPLMSDVALRFPPFTESKLSKINLINALARKIPSKRTLLFFGFLIAAVVSYYFYPRPN